jgi:hypothetical protein
MKFDFVRNIQFTKLLKVNGQLKEFNFRKANPNNDGIFSVDVSDDRGNRVMLQMQKDDGTWKIITPGLPKWVQEKEVVFNEVIEEELK